MGVRAVRRIVALVGVLTFNAVDATAFHVDFHVEITEDAMARVGRELSQTTALARQNSRLPAISLPATEFTYQALKEIIDANKAKDLDDCSGDKSNFSIPASPCTRFASESIAALEYLAKEPPEDHFDAETIQLANNNLSDARNGVVDDLRQGKFVAARKRLGGALHTLQDFYAHSNWVELGYINQIETLLGTGQNVFTSATVPRIATDDDEMCTDGDKLISHPSPILTTGYFYITYPEGSASLGDPPKITELHKCRHGWEVPGTGGTQGQPGINKDRMYRQNFMYARNLALEHTFQFVSAIISDPMLVTDPNYDTIVLGLLGRGLIEGVAVGVPGAPNGDSWDTAIGSVLSVFTRGINGLKNIQPDIFVCLNAEGRSQSCAPTCEDADWVIESNAYVCIRDMSVPAERIHVLVREVDFGQPLRVIADFMVDDPTRCNQSNTSQSVTPLTVPAVRSGALPTATPDGGACRLQLDADRQLWIQFQLRGSPELTPPVQPPPTTPPDPGGSTLPVPPTVTPVSPPPPTPIPPGPVPTPVGPSPPPPSPPPPAPGTGGGGGGTRLPTPEEIDSALGLRDADNCVGTDTFYPPGTAFIGSPLGQQLGPDKASQLYQMAAFAIAITDPMVKQAVLNTIRAKVGDDAFFGATTQVLGDLQQSRALVAAYQALAQNFVTRVVSTGLYRFVPPPKPAMPGVPDVDRWILKRLGTAPLVSSAIDMMSAGAPPPISAECTLNELAKQGFTDAIYGR